MPGCKVKVRILINEKTYITYFSTGIVGSFLEGSNVQLIFKPKTYLVKDEVFGYIRRFYDTHPTDHKNWVNICQYFTNPRCQLNL